MRQTVALLLGLTLAASVSERAWALSYELVQHQTAGGRQLSGTLETDGTLGALTSANLVPALSSITITGPNGFSGWAPDWFLFESPSPTGITATEESLFLMSQVTLTAGFDDANQLDPACASCSALVGWLSFGTIPVSGSFGFKLIDDADDDPDILDFALGLDLPLVVGTRVPEPSSALLFTLGVLLVLRARRRG